MTPINAADIKAWKISYNPYVDLFQIFDEGVFSAPNETLKERQFGDTKVLYPWHGSKPLLIELKNAYSYLGDIDNMSKADIIQSVLGHVRTMAETPNKPLNLNVTMPAIVTDGHALSTNNDNGDTNLVFFQISPQAQQPNPPEVMQANAVSNLRLKIDQLKQLAEAINTQVSTYEANKKKS